MSGAAAIRPRLRYVETSLRELGIPEDSTRPVHQVHLEGCSTLDEAVDVYRGVFQLPDSAGVTVTSDHRRTVIGMGGGGINLIRLRGDHRLLSDEMVVHR